jgi:hypothetical protein
MAKIISHDFSSLSERSVRQTGISLFTRSFGYYAQQLEEKKRLLDEMAAQARIFIACEKMDPEDFVLSGSYVRDFLCVEIDMEHPDHSSYAELVFHRMSEDRIISVCEFAVPEKDGKLEVSFLIYSLPGYREGNRTWCLYDFEHEEWVEQDEDCFDLGTVLEECGRHWDP